ncbi:hypothetical protein ACIRRH_43165 [Kitasatospora sp. NPDC101235]|uniref:hypothetical protein n=1 Tax=Kitasatospora sp. NPDC101235 TaxID=3364101 RepID=UPI003818409B
MNSIECPDPLHLLFSSVITSRRPDVRRSSGCRDFTQTKPSSIGARQAAPAQTTSAGFSERIRPVTRSSGGGEITRT